MTERLFYFVLGWVAFMTAMAVHNCHTPGNDMPVHVAGKDNVPAGAVGIECHRDNGCPITVPSNDAGVVVIMPCDLGGDELCWRRAPDGAVGMFVR